MEICCTATGTVGGQGEHHTVDGLRPQTQNSDERLSDEVRRSCVPDTHRSIFKCEATDCDGLYDLSSCDKPSSICDGKILVGEVGRITFVVVVGTPSAGIPCRKRWIKNPSRVCN